MTILRNYSVFLALALAAQASALSGCAAGANEPEAEKETALERNEDIADGTEASDDDDAEPVGEAAQALTDVTLQPFQTVTCNTWAAWGWTNVRIWNSDSSQGGHVSLQAGAAAPEYVSVDPASQLCSPWWGYCFPSPGVTTVARQWWGLPVHITNVSSMPLDVKVW